MCCIKPSPEIVHNHLNEVHLYQRFAANEIFLLVPGEMSLDRSLAFLQRQRDSEGEGD